MWDMNQVRSIEYKRDYVYELTFDDGLCAEVDFKPLLDRGPIFEPLKDSSSFRKAMIEGGTIAWPNGADVAPESLYKRVESANQGKVRAG